MKIQPSFRFVLTAATLAGAMTLLVQPTPVRADAAVRKVQVKNNTGRDANDLHVSFTERGVREAGCDKLPVSSHQGQGPPWTDWDFSGGTVTNGGSATVTFRTGSRQKEKIAVTNCYWTDNGTNIGNLKTNDVSGDRAGYRVYSREIGPGGPIQAGFVILNEDPLQPASFEGFSVWVGNDPSHLNLEQFDTPTGTPVPGLPPVIVLGPGQQFDTGYLPPMPPGTYLLAKAVLTEPGAESGTMNWAYANDCQPEAAPIPTVGQWGLIVLALLLLIAGTLALRSRVGVAGRAATG